MGKKKICLIYNFAQHYRTDIFKLIDKEFDCDFVFGDSYQDVKKMDYSLLKGKVTEVKNIRCKHFYYQKGVPNLICKKYDAYIILGEPRCLSTWLLLIFSLFYPKKRIYLWSHGWYGKENILKKIIERIFYILVDGLFIYNNRSKELMTLGGINKDKLYVIYNSLDYDRQVEQRNKVNNSDIYISHFGNRKPNIVFIGRLTKVKQLDRLIDVVKRAKENNIHINMTFIGDGESRSILEQLSLENGTLDRVWFYGQCYNEEKLSELIFNADLCVSPGNVGLTAMHALVYGCPIITHDNFKMQMPEFESIQKGITGDFYKYGDQQSLYDTIIGWLLDKKDRNAIRVAAYKEIDTKWNPHYQIKVLKKVINR